MLLDLDRNRCAWLEAAAARLCMVLAQGGRERCAADAVGAGCGEWGRSGRNVLKGAQVPVHVLTVSACGWIALLLV